MNRLVGRAPELRQLLAALSRVESGRSETIAIEGESGIGRSRLLTELETQARALGWNVGGQAMLDVTFERSDEFTIPSLPTLFALDDAQLLDDESLKLLGALSQRRDVQLMIVATFAPSTRDAVKRLRSQLDAQQGATVTLSGLSEIASRDLATAVLGTELTAQAAFCLEGANGNPSVICERMVASRSLASNQQPDEYSPARSVIGKSRDRHNLPLSLTPLIGREVELAQLRDVVKTERLVTIAGAGGCGKTRLAVALAHHLLDDEPGRVLWIELASLSDGGGCVSAVAAALGVPQISTSRLVSGIVDALRNRGVTTIIFDNTEHVVEAAADLAMALVSVLDAVKIVCTSREPLGAQGEVVWRLPSLSFPALSSVSGSATQPIAEFDSVRLFIDRASRARRGFELTDQNAGPIANICARLDGLPLAIELAAARVALMAPERIAEQLNDRFRLLTGGSRTAVPRQQTLQASVAWSEELLDVADRASFRRLGVFVGGFTLDAATAVLSMFGVIDERDVPQLLGRLVKKSLVNFDERNDRYNMLETIRTFALQRLLETNEAATARDVHAECFARWLEVLNANLYGSTMQAFVDRSRTFSRQISSEQPNCYAALGWVVAGSPLSLRLCAGLGYYWLLGQNSTDAIGFGASILVQGDKQSQGWLDAALEMSGVLGNAENTVLEGFAAKVAARATQSGDARAILRSEYHSGWNLGTYGPTDEQLAIAANQRERAEAIGDWFVLLHTTVFPLMVMATSGRLKEARNMLGKFEHYRTLLAAAVAARQGGDFDQSARLLDDADPYLDDLPSESGEILLMTMAAAKLALLTRDPTHLTDRRYLDGRSFVFAGTANPSRVMSIGLVHLINKDLVAARDAFRPVAPTYAAGRTARWLCQVEAALGEFDSARVTARTLIDLWKAEITPAYDASAFLVLAECDMSFDLSGALDNAHRSLAVAAEFGLWPAVIDALESIGSLLISAGRVREAARLLGASSEARDRMKYRYRFAHRESYVSIAYESVVGDLGWGEGQAMNLPDAVALAQRMRGERLRSTTGWGSLTPTELQVVELVATGLTNPQVADRLFMSRATVKTHLVHVYDKLGIATRAELASQAARRSVDQPLSVNVNHLADVGSAAIIHHRKHEIGDGPHRQKRY